MSITAISVDSPLGRWTHHEWSPPRLAGVVDTLWHFEGRTTMPRERVFPGGYLEIILHLGAHFRAVGEAGATGDAFPTACVTGMQLTSSVIEAPADGCCVLGIRLRPVGAFALLGLPLHATTGLTVDLADVAGPATAELAARVGVLPTAEARLRGVAAWLEGQLARASPADPAIAWVASQLEQHHGAVPIAALRERTGIARTRFAATFRAQVGVSPKRYARVLRFRRALALLHGGSSPAEAALTSGYYDQPHLNADFREFAGMAPTAFTTAARYPNSPSLAEAR
ncbi:MAG: helix-turn-helix domain-containing protein [Gemmatirosa sp.]